MWVEAGLKLNSHAVDIDIDIAGNLHINHYPENLQGVGRGGGG